MSRPVCLTLAALLLVASSVPLPAQTAPPSLADGLAALRANHPDQALTAFQRALAADPSSAAAALYAATAALELYNGPLAVQYAEKARQLNPQDWKVDTTLVAAYAAAGNKTQRDALRAQLRQLHASGAPDARAANGFLIEMFPVDYRPAAGPAASYHIDAIEYFEPIGELRTYYRFLIRRSSGGPRLWEIDVQSNDFDETSWAQAHRADAASGLRQFQISGRNNAGQETDYRLLTSRDDYDAFRAQIVAILQSQPLPTAQ